MLRLCLVMLAAVLALALMGRVAWADERVLQWDNGVADLFIHEGKTSHFVLFTSPKEWEKTFPVEVMFYAKRYGDVGNIKGTVVIWGPQTEKTAKVEDIPESLVIYSRQTFELAAVPEQPGWFTVPVETLELPKEFAVSVFTYSTDARGVELGLTGESANKSHSTSAKPEPVTMEALSKARDKGKPVEGGFKLRDDGREWMLRIKVRPSPQQEQAFTAEQLQGEDFSVFDDGGAEGWLSVQKNGPLLHVVNPGKRLIDRIYVYAKADGDWFNSTRAATVYILDSRFNIVSRSQLPYARYTGEPSWNYASFERTTAPKEFFVLITPNCRPNVGLLLGYDTSGKNNASLFGTPGAQLPWNIDAPNEKTNWMIRVKYK
jgi:hypothetical protein